MSSKDKNITQRDHQVRYLAWDACYNAREVGGYPATGNRQTRWRTLVRADNLYRLTSEGQAELRDYGIRTIIDLRFAPELEREANPFSTQQNDEGTPRYLHRPVIDHDDVEGAEAMNAAGSMLDEYIIILERNKERIASVINAVAEGLGEGGVLVHCHGGKDRTGIIVALLLSLVGVPRATIVDDYAISEAHLEAPHSAWLEAQIRARGEPVERPRWMYSRPATIKGALEYLDREYGSVDGYLEAAGVKQADMARIRKYLVAPVDDARL